jgi:PEP-CTERM motif-containing protein
MRISTVVACACLTLGLVAPASATPVLVRFDELPPLTPVHGTTVAGVTFSFTIGGVANPDARFNCNLAGLCPPDSAFLDPPALEGNAAGVLTFDFATPTSALQFGVARGTSLTLTPGVTVRLFDPTLALIGSFALATSNVGFGISEGLFVFSGSLLSRAVLTFDNPALAGRFGLDNLTYEQIPEPATLILVAAGMVGVAVRRRRTSGPISGA